MKFSAVFATAFAVLCSSAVAIPTGGGGGGGVYDPCTNIYNTPFCCGLDVLGVVGLDCTIPDEKLTSASQFASVCATGGGESQCCFINFLGQAVLCQDVVGN